MAKKSVSKNVSDETRTRAMCDYVFEEHVDGEPAKPIGIVLNYPRDIDSVRTFLESRSDDLGIKGSIKVCKKIYS